VGAKRNNCHNTQHLSSLSGGYEEFYLFHAGFMLGLIFGPENAGGMFI
jgi:hypothetical protein